MCSRVLWNDNGQAVLVGRTMDWMEDFGTNLWVLPRGGTRHGMGGTEGLEWPVRYGSVIAGVRDLATSDGINEAGLGAHLLWLTEADFGESDANATEVNARAVSAAAWAQVFLDSCATVDDCVEFMRNSPFSVRPVVEPNSGQPSSVHLALDDSTGDSMIIEYIGGKPIVHHGRGLGVMTNSPPYSQQLSLLDGYAGFGGDAALPGGSDPQSRFVRASYYLNNLPKPESWRNAVAALDSVMGNLAQPFGVADSVRPEISSTLWRTLADLTHRVYFFESSFSPYLIWVNLDDFELDANTPPMRLDLSGDEDRSGNVHDYFEPSEPFPFLYPAEVIN